MGGKQHKSNKPKPHAKDTAPIKAGQNDAAESQTTIQPTIKLTPTEVGKNKSLVPAATLFVGVLVAIIYFFQLREMIHSNEINRESLQTVQRAYMVVESEPRALTPERDIKTGVVTAWHFQTMMENVGNTATQGLNYHTNLAVWSGPLPSDFTYPDLDANGKPCRIHAPQAECAVVYAVAGPKVVLWSHDISLPKEMTDKIKDGAHIYAYGWVDYRDVFAWTPRHRTEYCYEVTSVGPVGPSFGNCPAHNCTDNDCKDYTP